MTRTVFIFTLLLIFKSNYAQDYNFIGKTFYRYQAKDSLKADSLEYSESILDSVGFMRNINKKGTIYRGIKINAGSGASIVSGLNLEIQGDLTDSIEVAAYISDDQLAVSEEGSTEAISDIEKIYIQFKHPNFLTRMGDFKTEYRSGEFGELKKDLSGALLRLNTRSKSIEGYVSAQSSQFETFRTTGSEGISGPYIIKNSLGMRLEIAPNSETVYLNGSRLTRGDDYYIDNLSSELYFKPHIHIKGSDIIIADYQYLSSDYKKNVYGFSTENSFLKNRLKTSINYYSESDDQDNPLSFDLTDEIINEMENNSDGFLLASGAEFTEGEGDYDLMEDSLHYVYAGQGNGDYTVRFSWFETGGEYHIADSLGALIFEYDSLAGGNYLPLVMRSTPKGYSRFHSDVNFTGRNIQTEAEFVASSSNENLFYSDEKKFRGFGDREIIILRTDEKSYGKFQLDLSRKSYNEELVLPSRLNKIFGEEEIDPYDQANSNNSSIYSAKIQHRFGSKTMNSYEAGYSEIGSNVTELNNKISSEGNFGRYSYAAIVSLSDTDNDSLDIEKKYFDFSNIYRTDRFKIRPYYKNITTKSFTDSISSGSDEKRFGNEFGFIYSEVLDLLIKSELASSDQIYQEDRRDYLKTYKNSVEMKNRLSSVLYSEAEWSRVVNDFISDDSTDTEYDQLNFRINYNKNDAYKIYAEYETERTQFVPKIRSYYKVEDGTGGYVYFDGEYFPDEFGNYDYSTSYSEKKKNLTGVKFDLKTFFDFQDQDKDDNILYWLSRIDIGQDLTIKEKTSETDISDIMFLNIAEFQTDSTINGTIESKTNLYFLKNGNNSFDYSYDHRRNLFREYQNYSENSLFREHTLAYKNRSGSFTHRFKTRYSTQERKGYHNIITDDLTKKYVSYNLKHNLNDWVSYSAEVEYGNETETVRGLSSDSYRMSNGLTAAFYSKGILRSGFDIIRINSEKNISYTMNSGYGKGWSYKWNFSSDYEFNPNITGNITYFGRYLSSDIKPFHELKAEIRMNL